MRLRAAQSGSSAEARRAWLLRRQQAWAAPPHSRLAGKLKSLFNEPYAELAARRR